jgi:hypothetical protein
MGGPLGTGLGWDPVKNEITLMSMPAGANADINANVAFDIEIDGVDVLSGQSMTGVLKSMSEKVECILMATEAECRRLGFLT